jgi:glycerophosphoryl diester phosphodiesterase
MREDVKPRGGGFYYSSINAAIADDGAVMEILHALATQAGVLGVFSDWPGTVTYYASCLSKRPTAGAER